MTDDRPRACTKPPWDDPSFPNCIGAAREQREAAKASNDMHACPICWSWFRGQRPNGICGICASRKPKDDDNPNILR